MNFLSSNHATRPPERDILLRPGNMTGTGSGSTLTKAILSQLPPSTSCSLKCVALHNVLVSCWSSIGPDSTAFLTVAASGGHGSPVPGAVAYAAVVTEAATQANDVEEKDYDARQHDEPTGNWESHPIVATVVNDPPWGQTKMTLKLHTHMKTMLSATHSLWKKLLLYLNSPLTLKTVQGLSNGYKYVKLHRGYHHVQFNWLSSCNSERFHFSAASEKTSLQSLETHQLPLLNAP